MQLNETAEIQAVKLEPGKVFHVPQGLWFNNVLSRDAKLIYIESADTKAAPDNSIYQDLTPLQIDQAKKRVQELL